MMRVFDAREAFAYRLRLRRPELRGITENLHLIRVDTLARYLFGLCVLLDAFDEEQATFAVDIIWTVSGSTGLP